MASTQAGSTVPEIEEPLSIVEVSLEELVEVPLVVEPPPPVAKKIIRGAWIDNEGKKDLEERFGVNHPLIEVARCESGYAQFETDGSIRRNPGSSAQGRFQVMASLHRGPALAMGMDIDTEEGNDDYAEYLYDKNGLRDWGASRHCWGSK